MAIKNSVESVYKHSHFTEGYDGLIFTFDLDKTYLATEFETVSGLIKIPFERAHAKKNIPGAAVLARELRRGVQKEKDYETIPLYFISGSPRQMENVIKEKFRLDGVEFDGILFKDVASAIRRFKFKKIIDKIGFKLGALLYGRTVFPHACDEILFGDDSEYDATIYSLYSDIISGRLEDYEVMTILKKWQVDSEEREQIEMNLARLRQTGWKHRDAVRRIFIHLETKSSPADFFSLSEKVTPTQNYFQAAVILYFMECLTKAALFRMVSQLIRVYGFQMIDFLDSTEDLLQRKLINKKQAQKLIKLVSKGNPLALPLQWLNDIRIEFNTVIDDFNRMQKNLFPSEPTVEAEVIDRYLQYVPQRRV